MPQLVSSSRHFTQGAVEISDSVWCCDDLTLTVTASLVQNDEYGLAIYLPDGYVAESSTLGSLACDGRLLRVSLTPERDGEFTFVIKFKKQDI